MAADPTTPATHFAAAECTQQVHDGDALDSARAMVEQLEEEQKRLLTALKDSLQMRPLPNREAPADVAAAGLAGRADAAAWPAHRPRSPSRSPTIRSVRASTTYMPSTSEYRYARYFEDWRARVEKIGNENYPEEARGSYTDRCA